MSDRYLDGLERFVATLPDPPFRVALVGGGSVGTAVASLLRDGGHDIASVSSRSRSTAEAAAGRLNAPVRSLDAIPDVDVVLLGIPESALTEVTLGLPQVGSVLVHFAGASGIEPLGSGGGGRALCALHPVQACPDVDTAIRRLPGSAWGVTCSDGAASWARRVVERDLQGVPVDVPEEHRLVWHAAAVATSNGISALVATGESLLASIGIDKPERVLGPIASGTVLNALERGGGAATLTGPVVRRETDLVGRHVSEIARRAPELLPSYVDTLHMIISSALATGRIDPADEHGLRQALDAG